jgi:hypothetical protein
LENDVVPEDERREGRRKERKKEGGREMEVEARSLWLSASDSTLWLPL